MCDNRRDFGLEIGYIDHLQIVTRNNYNSLTNFTHFRDNCNYSTQKIFSVFVRRFLVTDFNTVRLSPYRLAHIPQLS
jgi:hypothetical protein